MAAIGKTKVVRHINYESNNKVDQLAIGFVNQKKRNNLTTLTFKSVA